LDYGVWLSRRILVRPRERLGLIAALAIQVALTAALVVWLTPRLIGAASAGLDALHLPALSDLTSVLAGLDGQLSLASAALSELARVGGAMDAGPFGAFTAAQWAMLLAGVGIVWFVSNRFLLAGSPERRGNSQEAA
jgi:hypothetical protein